MESLKRVSRRAQDRSSRGLVRSNAPRYRLSTSDRPCRCGRRERCQDEAARSPHQRLRAAAAGMKTRPGGFRLLLALLLLAVPLAVAAWGLGGYSAQRERNNADTRLIDSLELRRRRLPRLVSDVDSAATTLATSGACSTSFSTAHPTPRLEDAGEQEHRRRADALARSDPGAAAVRRIDFLSKGRTVGQVVVFLPLDRSLVGLADARSRSRSGPADRAWPVARASSLRRGRCGSSPVRSARGPSTSGRAALGYRTVSEDLGPAAPQDQARRARAAAPRSTRRRDSARWRVVGLGLAVVARAARTWPMRCRPSIARSRVSRQERERAERVLAHVGRRCLPRRP